MGNKITRRCSAVDERYTRPQGLYPQRDVDQKKLRRLILDSKLAPCFPGEEETSADCEECPICFLYYPSLNRSKCCSKGVCTECFLQMKSPRAARSTQCPFCKSHNYAVEYRGSKTLEEKGIEAAEEQKFIEAKIRMRKQELLEDEQREQRKEESERAATPPLSTSSVELPESRSSQKEDESVTSVSCEEDLESWACEEYGSEGSLAPTPQPPLPCSERVTEPPPPPPPPPQQQQQLQPGLTPPRHREDEFDFDLEDIMVMEAIWQSIQDQGTRHGYTASEPPRLSHPEMSDDVVAVSEVAGPEGGSMEYHHPRMAPGGLASAIAALAERRAVKGDATPPKQQAVSNADSPSVELLESDLHTSRCSSEDDGASTSSVSLSCVAPVNSPVMTINRCATDADGKANMSNNHQSIVTC